MGQVTIYLEDDIEVKMVQAAKSANLSKSKWIARLIQERVATEWPKSVADMAGSWEDFPDIDTIRHQQGKDIPRETF